MNVACGTCRSSRSRFRGYRERPRRRVDALLHDADGLDGHGEPAVFECLAQLVEVLPVPRLDDELEQRALELDRRQVTPVRDLQDVRPDLGDDSRDGRERARDVGDLDREPRQTARCARAIA